MILNKNNTEISLKEAILDRILETNDIEVPQDQVNDEVRMMVIEYKHRKKYESMASGGIFSFMQEDMTDLMKAFNEEAFKLVKTRLLLKEIIESEDFEISKEELEEEAKGISVRQQISLETVKDFLGEDLEVLKKDLLVRKAMDYIYINAVTQ